MADRPISLPLRYSTADTNSDITLACSVLCYSWFLNTLGLFRGGSCHQSTCCALSKPGTCRGAMKALHSLTWLITRVLVEWICNLQKCHEVTSKNCLNLCDLIRIWIQRSRGKSHRALCEVPYSHISVYNFVFSPLKGKGWALKKSSKSPKAI